MKKLSVRKIVLFVFVLSGFLSASPIEELVTKGNELYQENKFNDAIKTYTQVIEQGYISAPLYYNLGNAYYRSGEIGKAILNYERGLKIDPDDEDIEYNLKLVKARTVDRIKDVPQIFIVEWWETALTSFSVSGWATLVIAFYLLLIFSVGSYFLIKNISLRRLSFIFGTTSIVFLIVAVVFLIARVNRETSTDFGIVTSGTVTVKLSPDEKSSDAFVVHEGLKVAVKDKLKGWARIKLPDGKIGWMPKSSFEII